MNEPLKEVLLVGFGAVGAIYALVLKRSNLTRVTVVARSNHHAVQEKGMNFQSRRYGNVEGWMPDRLCKSVADAADQSYSYVVVATKAVPDVITTSKIVGPLLSKEYNEKFSQPIYVLVQNGLNIEIDLYNTVMGISNRPPTIVSCAIWIHANLISPNIVEHSEFDRLAIGIYRHQDRTTTVNSTNEVTLLHNLGSIFTSGGGTVDIVPEIQRVKFHKNLLNVAFASFATLTQYRIPAIFRPPPPSYSSIHYEPYVSPTTVNLISEYTIPTIKAILEELVVLARALGYPDTPEGIPSSLPTTALESTRDIHVKADNTHAPSMLLDSMSGRPIEVEVIFGELVRMAKDVNVNVPRLEMLYALLLVIQNQTLRKLETNNDRIH